MNKSETQIFFSPNLFNIEYGFTYFFNQEDKYELTH